MPIRDTAARNKSLDLSYGANRGALAPATHQLALFVGNPDDGGTELSNLTGGVANGYARVSIPNNGSSWAAAADGLKQPVTPFAFPTVTAADGYEDTVTHWALFDAADGTTMWDYAELTEPLDVTASGAGPQIVPTIFYDDSVVGA